MSKHLIATLQARLVSDRWLVYALIAANILLLVGLSTMTTNRVPREVLVPFGHDASNVLSRLPADKDSSSPAWQYLMVLMVEDDAVTRNRGRLTFIDEVYRTLKGRQLRIVLATNRRSFDILKPGSIEFVDDGDGGVHRAFNVVPGHGHGGIAVLKRTGEVNFRDFSVPDVDQARQLVEKYATGTISYAVNTASLMELFPVGSTFPNLRLTSVATGRETDSASELIGRQRVVLFAAACGECQFRSHIATLAGAL